MERLNAEAHEVETQIGDLGFHPRSSCGPASPRRPAHPRSGAGPSKEPAEPNTGSEFRRPRTATGTGRRTRRDTSMSPGRDHRSSSSPVRIRTAHCRDRTGRWCDRRGCGRHSPGGEEYQPPTSPAVGGGSGSSKRIPKRRVMVHRPSDFDHTTPSSDGQGQWPVSPDGLLGSPPWPP